jgi:hypothetical protein
VQSQVFSLRVPKEEGAFLPDSDRWIDIISSHKSLSIFNDDLEVEYAKVERVEAGFVFHISTDDGVCSVRVSRDYVNIFTVMYVFENVMGGILKFPPTIVEGNNFSDRVAFNLLHYGEANYRKILDDFSDLYPSCEVVISKSGDALSGSIPDSWRRTKNEYDVVKGIDLCVSSIDMIEYHHILRLWSFLNNFSTGCRYHNKFFKEVFLTRKNCFLDN